MTAQEAREKTEKAILENNNKAIFDITKQIDTAVASGEFSIIIYQPVHEQVLKHFKELGYTYKIFSDRDDNTQVEIKWGN